MLSGIFIFMNIEVYLLENKQLQYRTFLISEDSKKVDRNIQNRTINE